jgi:raffinose/stachyose/melibiose transport system permease protein
MTATAPAPTAGRTPDRPRAQLGARTSALILLTPALGLCAVFIVIPAVLAIAGSFYTFGITSREWQPAGLSNYSRAFADPIFWIALRNNLIIVLGSIVLQVGIGTILAAMLDRGLPRGATIFRTIIKGVGLTPPTLGWLGDPDISIWVVLVIACWQYTGFMMVLILAGLQGIPKELYEAAALDGAKGFTAFRHITLPSIRNVLIVAVLITTIGGFKVFDLIFATTHGGPANATQVLGTCINLQAFNLGNMGYANAISVILLMIAVVLGWVQITVSRKA